MKSIYLAIYSRLYKFVKARPEYLVLGLLLLLYVPFLGQPVLRTTGDEKVYVAQALEMAEHGSWFQQTLAEQANYYKPPLHYMLLRFGFIVFGQQSLWAVLWMNLLALVFGTTMLAWALRKSMLPGSTPLLLGLGILFAPGIFAHMFASQMEIELLGVYSCVLALALRLWVQERTGVRWIILWTFIGVASWIKSPVHSALMGLGIVLLVIADRELRIQYLKLAALAAPCLGIVVGALSLVIPLLLDPQPFYATYILRETMGKGSNGVGVLEALLPNLSYHLWPYIPMLGFGSLAIWRGFRQKTLTLSESRAVACSLALALPTLLFFIGHPYRSEIYMLPALPAILLWAVVGWQKAQNIWPTTSCYGHKIWLAGTIIPALLIIALDQRFHPSHSWWPYSLTAMAWAVLTIQLILLLNIWRSHAQLRTDLSMLLWLPSLVLAALLMQVVGRFDLKDLQAYSSAQENDETYGFYNAQKFLWSEWGLLNFTGGLTVKGLHRFEDITAWIAEGKPLIIPRRENLEMLRHTLGQDQELAVSVWKRWQSHGEHTRHMGPKAAWDQGNLELLQGNYYIVRLKGPPRVDLSDLGF